MSTRNCGCSRRQAEGLGASPARRQIVHQSSKLATKTHGCSPLAVTPLPSRRLLKVAFVKGVSFDESPCSPPAPGLRHVSPKPAVRPGQDGHHSLRDRQLPRIHAARPPRHERRVDAGRLESVIGSHSYQSRTLRACRGCELGVQGRERYRLTERQFQVRSIVDGQAVSSR
jgi:hypothetical protein